MASLPSPTQVAGKHNAIYEAYYKQVDPKGLGSIQAMDAAKFLKKSGLSDVVLSRIWDLSDPRGRGCLDKAGFFVSLKLVALAQAGNDINMRNIFLESPNPPKVGEIPKIMPQTIQSVPAGNTDWSMKVTERLKYEQLFDSLQPVNGLIAGNKVKGVLMDSKLPLDTLGKIWDLADQDKDGSLDKHEFQVAMHLVYQALAKRAVPSTLPPELQKPKPASIPKAPSVEGFGDSGFVANFPKDIAPPPVPPLPAIPPVSRVPQAVPTMPLISADPIAPTVVKSAAPVDWVVTPNELVRFEGIFRECDRDMDGLVSGLEIKDVFLQSGVPQNCLAHIWALCDQNQSGKLTLEQFALAMWMVERKKSGIEPPEALAPNMMPPSFRTGKPSADVSLIQSEPQPTYSNPELEMISKEIEEFTRERRIQEADKAQKEADIRIKTGELRSLQSELDTLAATLKQLENQRGEAQKRLDDLKAQVDKIREQCRKQEETINEQESELNSKRSELQKLKDEESALEKEYESKGKELDNLTRQLQDTQLQISQVKAMVTQLLETQRQMTDAFLLCKAAIESNDPAIVSDYSLKIEPDFRDAKDTLEKQDQPKPDPFVEKAELFENKDAFGTNGFSSDPFANTNGTRMGGGFDDNFSAPLSGFDDAFSSGFTTTTTNQTKDPFSSNTADPFGDKKSTAVTPEPGKDDFGSDPFAILHAPTGAGQILSPSPGQKSGPPPRPESPSPALPPKKSKQPPPRPAPPRPLQGPTRPAPPVSSTTDAFGSSTGGFADFADFDNKQPTLVPPPTIQPPSIVLPKIPLPTPAARNLPKTQPAAINKPTTIATTVETTKKPSSPAAPTDFKEDPFKDYRYEDPFNIEDPFSNEDFDESSEGTFSDDKKKDSSSGNTAITKSSDFIDNLKQPNRGPSNRTTPDSTADASIDHFFTDPFGDNNNQSTNINLKTTTIHSRNSLERKKFFSDPFGDNNNTAATTTTTTTTTKLTKNSSGFSDLFFDAFNDNFKSIDNKNLKSNNSAAFDAFGDSKSFTANKTTKSSKVFDDFNDNFEDDFFKMKISPDNNDINGDFAKFDAFGDDFAASGLNDDKNLSQKLQNKNAKPSNDKIPDKFAEDYSNTDNFDADLQAALERSVVEK